MALPSALPLALMQVATAFRCWCGKGGGSCPLTCSGARVSSILSDGGQLGWGAAALVKGALGRSRRGSGEAGGCRSGQLGAVGGGVEKLEAVEGLSFSDLEKRSHRAP